MTELHEQVIALLHLAQNLVEPQSRDKGFERLPGFGVVGNRHARLEESGQHLPPARRRFPRLVGDGGVARHEHRGNVVHLVDPHAVHAGSRIAEFESQFVVPVEHALFAVVEAHLAAAGRVLGRRRDLEVAHVHDECARLEFPGGGGHFLQHQPPRFGFDRGDTCAGRITEGDGDVEVAFRHLHRKKEGLLAGDPARDRHRSGPQVEAIAGFLAVHRTRQHLDVTRLGGADAEIECERGGWVRGANWCGGHEAHQGGEGRERKSKGGFGHGGQTQF